MIRILLFLSFVLIIAVALSKMARAERESAEFGQGNERHMISPKFSRITYILLLILLFGVTSGILGAA